MKAPPGLADFEATLEAGTPGALILMPRDWTLALIRYVRALEDEREDVGVGMTDKWERGRG